ncbi:uncharacterized protein TA18985 [Theileria annulata]|uniref:Radical SAM core domain-containing protein n=1 Tax=Theileria annulata TaxID=5874 RepID=Q4UG78_THEAN|nr:uncharacterized protein TA18985 [Theileria annulata]CAI73911.1 hypothetical protein, conserved [Theileria annulata]|eukprot:XP_954588.1 hypothetical protein, conserved [Theileria annulata]
MAPKIKEQITIIFSDENKSNNSQKLASEIALEYLNVKRSSKCIPLDSLLDFKNEPSSRNSNDSESSDGSFSEFANILKNGSTHQNDERNIIIFVFESHRRNLGIMKLENVLNDWLSDFRVDKSIFLNLNVIFVIQENDFGSADIGENEDFVNNLRELLGNLGSKILFQKNFYLKSGDVGQILSLIDLISDASSSIPSSYVNNNTNHRNVNDTNGVNTSDETSEEENVDIENLAEMSQGMTTSKQRFQLIKQGYKLIGDHSAVKLCRWTKSRVRGHGGCYKHTFYGINSNQCMEMTPSLACANKCVFCWRHHTNPVSTKWKWDQDDPKFIVSESITAHLKLIKELKGIFDTKQERFNEALKIRHCALSLVGEPIMYPQINELIRELHTNQISTFLVIVYVTNAQFPKEMETLVPVTQLYVSIDASDKVSLKNIGKLYTRLIFLDRPLFRDFWERFLKCIELLKYRRERTVFRLTLVRNFNMTEQKDEIEGYANLIKLGEPDFVEIKAVTFCGNVEGNAITMKNVPWHDEVCGDFVELFRLLSTSVNTGIHVVFLSQKMSTFYLLPKILKSQVTNGIEFSALDYSCETPEWALFGSPEQGFDPEDTR